MTFTRNAAAVVTGGARGIGAAIARRLAADGLAVAVIDLNAEAGAQVAAAIRADGGRALFVAADITEPDQVENAVDRVAAELAPPLVAINNAGLTRDDLLFKLSPDDWDLVMRVHLRGAFLVSKATQRHMVEAKWGRIVSMSSTSALGNRGQANYSAAKAGLQGLTKTLAIELGPFGVTANAIAPGFIATDMTAATAERMGITFEEFVQQSAERIPVRRVGTPNDIASTVSFLVSEEAGFVSGQVIYVAGGPKA
jgi:3-oxoacyl-[acyl-carrier protein] reductase